MDQVMTPEEGRRLRDEAEAAMRGTLASSGRLLQFNCPNWNFEPHDPALPPGIQCLDGLQRYTAVQRFMAGEIQAFRLPVETFYGTAFDPKRFMASFAICGDLGQAAQISAEALGVGPAAPMGKEEGNVGVQ